MPRAKQRTEQLREHIVQTAVAMLAADGVGGFTTRRVAERAQTSPPAVYELFGDKAGLVREVFFEGFRLLGDRFGRLPESDDPRADLLRTVQSLRTFVRDNPVLAQVMFSRPFADFDPGATDLEAGAATREFIVHRVQRCIDAGIIDGDAVDIAHGLLALTQGLAAQEAAGWLGSTRASVNRRWDLAVLALLAGLSAERSLPRTGSTAAPAAILFDRLSQLELADSQPEIYDRPIGLRMLYQDPVSGAEHYLIRYPAGLRARHHSHSAAHTIIVLDGTMEANGQILHAGSYAHFPAGIMMHHAPARDEHCLFVLIFDGPFDVVPAEA